MKKPNLEKRALQIAVVIGGLVPIIAGFSGMIFGPSMLGDMSLDPNLDSHYRYLSGLLFGIGLAFYSTIKNIENNGALFFLLTAIVFIGGLARLSSLLSVGVPDCAMIFGLVMELIVVPALALWQYRISKA